MFSSISKVWNEVLEEEGKKKENSSSAIKFSPSTKHSNRKTTHYIHHDTINPIERIRSRTNESLRTFGSPHILKPTNKERLNKVSFWDKVGKLGKSLISTDDPKELNDMKGYLNGMVKKRSRYDGVSNDSVDELNLKVIKKKKSSLRERIASVNERANNFKVVDHSSSMVPPTRPQIRKIERNDLYSSDLSNDNLSDLINQRKSLPLRRTSQHKLAVSLSDLPSSPYEKVNSQTPCISGTPYMESTPKEDVTFETIQELKSQVDSFRSKVEDLETTIESLKSELQKTNERSIMLESSFEKHEKLVQNKESNDKDEDFLSQADEHTLSPVKLDLGRFKLLN